MDYFIYQLDNFLFYSWEQLPVFHNPIKFQEQPSCFSYDFSYHSFVFLGKALLGLMLQNKEVKAVEYYSAIKKEWNNVICSNMDGPRDYHTKWSNSDRER